jgi:hypothetical protein
VLTHTTSTHMDRKELLMGVNFARNFMDDLLLPWGKSGGLKLRCAQWDRYDLKVACRFGGPYAQVVW